MSPILKTLGIDQMSLDERVSLVEEIWESILGEEQAGAGDQSDETPLTEGQRAELERRLAAFEADPKAGSTWEEVEARLRRRP